MINTNNNIITIMHSSQIW